MKKLICLIFFAAATVHSHAQTNINFTTLFAFDGTNGARPGAGLTLGIDGNLYGTTCGGGEYGKGTIFKITSAGKLTTLFSFDGTNGYTPDCELVQGRDGKLYGTTRNGGNHYDNSHQDGCGTLFQITTDGTEFTNLFLFNGEDDFYGKRNGSKPIHGLTVAADGYIYGMTIFGGATGDGTLFRVNTSGDFKTLLSFSMKTPKPDSGLILGRDGNLYGTTSMGGKYQKGTFFKLTSDGQFLTRASFNHTNLFMKHNNLVQAIDGSFYGTTENGGEFNNVESEPLKSGDGTAFKATANGVIKILASFNGYNGSHPENALVQGLDGNFYGTTKFGSPTLGTKERKWETHGTLFRVSADGVITTIFSFDAPKKRGDFPSEMGGYPNGLVRDANGNFYGTTTLGGKATSQPFGIYGNGTIFRF